MAAADGPFGGLIVSGWHTAALTMRLLVENYLSAEASRAGVGAGEIRWPDPAIRSVFGPRCDQLPARPPGGRPPSPEQPLSPEPP